MKTKKQSVVKQAQGVIDQVAKDLAKSETEEKSLKLTATKKKKAPDPIKWDFPLSADISFFDANLSYEISGYRPITKTQGLDFNPEWFLEARNTFLRTGHYTSYLPGSKGYRDFWHEEYRRCKQGLTVNGYTVTGEHYFFLNYYKLPIVDGGTKAGSGRSKNFPAFFVSQYQFFHYVDIAKKCHKHTVLMKARGVGFSEISASMSANQYTTIKESITMIACYDKGKLERTLSKTWDALRFLDTSTDGGMFKLRQLSDTALIKKSGHFNMSKGNKTPAGWQSMIEGVVADDPQKIRGDRVDLMVLDEFGCHAAGTEVLMADGSIKKVENIVIGDKVMGDDGTPRTVIQLHTGTDKMYKIIPRIGDTQIVNSGHILYGKHRDYGKGTYEPFTMKMEDFYNMVSTSPRKQTEYKLVHSNAVSFPHKDVPIDPYLFGLWLGDGDASQARFTSADSEILEYLQQYANTHNLRTRVADCSNSVNCKQVYLVNQQGQPNSILQTFRELGVLNHKDIPDCYIRNDRETLLQLLAGFIDSDGTYNPATKIVEIIQYEGHKHLLDKLELICGILGLRTKRTMRISKERVVKGKIVKGGVPQHRLQILYGHSQIPCKLPRKQSVDRDNLKKKSALDRLDTTFKVERAGIDKFYGFSLDGNQLFLLKDFTVCHNSWPDSAKAFVQAQALVEVQGVAFGLIQAGGTGGDKGSALAGLNEIYYHPEPFGVLPYRHNYTSDGSTILSGYFIPAFTQSMVPGMTDHRGYCDEEANKAYLQKKRDQYLNVPQSLIHHCAEYCWNAEEAFALEGDNKFNKVLLSEQLAQIRLHKTGPRPTAGYIDYLYKDGQHKPENITGFKWISTKEGRVLILEHPVWSECYKQDLKKREQEAINRNQKFEVPPVYKEMNELYVAGVDGIDIGKNQTSSETKSPSEFCLIIYKRVLGLSDPQIVCVYKDRPNEVRTAYKTAMCLLRYYNCKVNVEATRVGFINWARYSNQLKWFMRRPSATLQNIKNGNSKSYGTPATATIIEMQTDLIANFVEDYCHTIWFEDVLDQLVRYNPDNKTKFDIIAALGMALLADQELTGRVPLAVQPVDEGFEDFGYYIDENGYRQWGIIPKQARNNIQYGGGQAYDPFRLDTSDTRYHQDYY